MTLLLDGYDVLLLDLDGTVYRGGEPTPGATEAVDAAHRNGSAIRYVTNNASKPPEEVADHLGKLGLDAHPDEVSTSAQAGAAVLADQLPAGARVLVVGSTALESEVDAAGLVPVRSAADRPDAVVQGHSPHTAWSDLAEACLAIRAGAVWVACNNDFTLPTERGQLPGNGAMVAALSAATARTPQVAGKPELPLLERAVTSAGGQTALMVGDRLETDIAGAVNAGLGSLVVLTGVSTAADVLAAPPELRPEHIAADLRALHRPAAESRVVEQAGWKVRIDENALLLERNGSLEDSGSLDGGDASEALPALRALCAAWWQVGCGAVDVRADDASAAAALRELGLPSTTETAKDRA